MSENIQVFNEEKEVGLDKILTFYLGEQIYGLEIEYVIEIIQTQAITKVPEIPAYMTGIINLRGKVIPVMNVRTRFGMPMKDYDEKTCIIVVAVGEMSVGLIVDMVCGVVTTSKKDISSTPNASRVNINRYIKYLETSGNEIKLVLDCQRLIADEMYEDIPSIEL